LICDGSYTPSIAAGPAARHEVGARPEWQFRDRSKDISIATQNLPAGATADEHRHHANILPEAAFPQVDWTALDIEELIGLFETIVDLLLEALAPAFEGLFPILDGLASLGRQTGNLIQGSIGYLFELILHQYH
jgi:hypothetical protein